MLGIYQLNVHQFALLLLAAALIVLVVVFVTHTSGKSNSSRRYRHQHRSAASVFVEDSAPNLTDYGQQLRAVEAASFEKQRLMNRSEYRAFKIVEDEILAAGRGYRVFAQTTLGEILDSRDEFARRSINSKRIDILVVDSAGWPIVAIECQGKGHYQNNAAARDAVKKEALRKAGVRYLEVLANESDEQIRRHLLEHLGWTDGERSERGRAERIAFLETSIPNADQVRR